MPLVQRSENVCRATILALLLATLPMAANAVIDEIMITSERRAASLQDTAISITALTGDDLVQNSIETTEQLAGLTPALQIQRDVIGKVVIRGIGTENFTIAGDPGVALSVDGAYISRSNVAIFDMFDMERVEVLRGPQGTLYGRNATGGAINFITNKPTDELDANVLVDVGEYSKIRVEAGIGGPIIEGKLNGRIAGLFHERDGYTDNIFPDVGRGLDELDSKELNAFRGHLDWFAADNVKVELSADIYNDDSNPVPYKYTDDPVVFFGGVPFPNPEGPDLRTVSQGFEFDVPDTSIVLSTAGRWDQHGARAAVTWDLDNGMTLKSITSYRNFEFEWLNDGDGLPAYLVNYYQIDDSDLITQELQLASADEGQLRWIAGAYYLDEDSKTDTGIPIPGFVGVFFNGEAETSAWALFGEVSWYFRDDLRLVVGGRFSQEDKDVMYVENRFGGLTTVNDSDDWSSFTPKIGLDYFHSDDLMFYASITRGFKSGGFNLLAVQPSYDEEEVTSLEIGTKSQWSDNRVQFNASAFYYDYEDLQVGKVVTLSATIQNAAEATIYGAEAEVKAQITDSFSIDAGLSLLSTEYDEFLTEDVGLPGAPEVNLKGNELPRAPGHTAHLSALWSFPLSNGGAVELWGNTQIIDRQYFTQFNRVNVRQTSYELYNAKITYVSPDQRWRVTAYADNLSDEEYFTNALESGVPTAGVDPVVPQFFVGAPSSIGVKVGYRY